MKLINEIKERITNAIASQKSIDNYSTVAAVLIAFFVLVLVSYHSLK